MSGDLTGNLTEDLTGVGVGELVTCVVPKESSQKSRSGRYLISMWGTFVTNLSTCTTSVKS